jgi:hypothetical protein
MLVPKTQYCNGNIHLTVGFWAHFSAINNINVWNHLESLFPSHRDLLDGDDEKGLNYS